MSAEAPPPPTAPPRPSNSAVEPKKPDRSTLRAALAPVLWFGAGSATAVAIVMIVRATEPPRTSTSSTPARPTASASAMGDAAAAFTELYLAYLLKSYYVDARGFCPNLLSAICAALVTTDLIANEKSCAALPNAELVLAIGRYQNGVGLPVDGKAGPETVRMILGGDFGSRREMANKYCPGAPAPSISR
ncbi:MAG: peptidoglycan-binding domain-containing protein [Polyangiaceae bacterium]